MDIFSVLSMIGGLSLFLYGMSVMGAGVTAVIFSYPCVYWSFSFYDWKG